ncbi:pyridoxamine 5'-phosphate oxidase [Mycobacterium sp. ACS1612]|uniref:pyridoxamine 5'-phosphate oxidase family protein n=1 Tax=Mycobacterium sp. ACS1612 TaxID=1834117 RepID=UPI00080167F3|nr:pyridoxamine 5'-phosphate oxidase family protein [Mycobacterium sp. ACS1612]OBF42164.1 pyridoxamine 5'-phosphate oxidase [Mycobacterium sp. ACS1612]
MTDQGFHDGELAVQERAGVRAQAARLGGAMLAVPDLNGGIGGFLAGRDFAVITARDVDGRLWISPLFAAPGSLQARDRTLRVDATPGSGDPLHGLPAGQPVGMLAIEFAIRRRARVNGTLIRSDPDGLELFVDQAFGNCPKYIHQRHLDHLERGAGGAERFDHLTAEHVALITHADTFFLGTVHPTRGADASHRGGQAGFVRVEDGGLWWPDYPGNNMFNSFGNIEVDPTASLLFIDFDSGTRLHVSGTAAVEWTAPNIRGDDGGVGRRVRFTVDSAVSITPPVT